MTPTYLPIHHEKGDCALKLEVASYRGRTHLAERPKHSCPWIAHHMKHTAYEWKMGMSQPPRPQTEWLILYIRRDLVKLVAYQLKDLKGSIDPRL